MKIVAYTFFFAALYCNAHAQMKISNVPPEQEKFYNTAMSSARPAISAWIKKEALKFAGKDITEAAVLKDLSAVHTLLGVNGDADINALVFLVLMQASKNAQDDLKTIMDHVKAINKQKEELRSAESKLNKEVAKDANTKKIDTVKKLTVNPNIARPVAVQKDKSDQLNEMSNEQEMKMQMALDRRSKAEAMAGNIFKKISATADTIISNLK